MFGYYLVAFDRKPERSGAHTDECRSLGQRHPSFSGTSLARIDRDLMVATQRSDSLLGPEVTPAGSQVIAIEHASNRVDILSNPSCQIAHAMRENEPDRLHFAY
jgi:hypothetical protein